MKHTYLLSVAALVAVAGAANADVVPNIYAATAAPGTFLTWTSAARSYLYVMDSSELTGLIGLQITGMRMRGSETATVAGPSLAMATSDYEVWIGPSVDPSAISTTVASNFTSGPTQVRDGAENIAQGSFGLGNPAPFGPTIALSSYLYTGGDLAIFMTWQGWTGGASMSLDATTTTSPGYGVTYAARWTGSFGATVVGSNANFLVTDLIGVVPEPGTFVALGAGLSLLALRLRRR